MGREAELTELAWLLADPDVRLLTILGAGGMGKTRLAQEAAAAELDNFQHGVYFVPLAPLQSVQAIVPTVAEAIGFRFYEGGEPRQQLLDYLRKKAKLIVMDNFEHLLACPEPGRRDGAGLVSDVLQTAPEVKILSTSRARLNVQGEHLFHLAGMDYPDWETPEDALNYSAVKLFLQSARRVQPGFELATADLKYVARICRLVQGMPLGILLAAGWLEMLTPGEIAAEISRTLDFLETDLRDVPERQRSMRAVFDHSWSLLTEREREVFQGLSVFRGGFTRQAAQQVTGASLRELMALVNKSLLGREPGGRYGIHELLRQYAAEQLEGSEVAEGVRQRHADFYPALAEEAEPELEGAEPAVWLSRLDAEHGNLRAALAWSLEGTGEVGLRLAGALGWFWRSRGQHAEGREWLAKALARSAEHGDGTDHYRAKALCHAGELAWAQGDYEAAASLEEESATLPLPRYGPDWVRQRIPRRGPRVEPWSWKPL